VAWLLTAALSVASSSTAGVRITEFLPMGRRLVKLTVDAPPSIQDEPRRGYRRVLWIEQALEPLRATLSADQFEDLVSSVAMVVGWEAFIVLTDVRGLQPRAAAGLCTRAAVALIDAATAPRHG